MDYFKHFGIGVASFLSLFIFPGYLSAAQNLIQNMAQILPIGEMALGEVELEKPVDLSELLPKIKQYPGNDMILRSSFILNGQEFTDFFVVEGKNKNQNLKEEFIRSRRSFISDMQANGTLNTNKSPETRGLESFPINGITLSGKKIDVTKVSGELVGKEMVNESSNAMEMEIYTPEILPTESREVEIVNKGTTSVGLETVNSPTVSFAPSFGISHFFPSVHGGRYVQQHMKWNSINFSSEQTYEHDVWLYNYDRKTYLDGRSTAYPGCFPKTTYALTSWPSTSKAYIDSRFDANDFVSCEIDELAYTIGAAQASVLQPNVEYYNYIRTADGNDFSDEFKLQAQVGHRVPSSCYRTWCSYGDQFETLLSFSNSVVPGYQSWPNNSQVPAIPQITSISNPTTSSLRVNFTDNATNETNVLVEKKVGVNDSWNIVGGFGPLSGTSNWRWTDSPLSSQTTYCYRLQALNSAGLSGYSNEVCANTL